MAILAWCYAATDVSRDVWATLPAPLAVFDLVVVLLGVRRLQIGREWLLTSELHVRSLLLFSFLFRLLSSLTLSLVLLDLLPLCVLPVPPCFGYLGGLLINAYAGDTYTWVRLHVLDLVVFLTSVNVVASSFSATPWSASCLLYPVFALGVAFLALTLLLWYVLITDTALRHDTLLRLAVNLLLHLSFAFFLFVIFLAQFLDQRKPPDAVGLFLAPGEAGGVPDAPHPSRRGAGLLSLLVFLFSPHKRHNVSVPFLSRDQPPLPSVPVAPSSPQGPSLLAPEEAVAEGPDSITATYWAIPLLFALLLVQIFAGSCFVFLVASHTAVSSPPDSPFLSLSAAANAAPHSHRRDGAGDLRGTEETPALTCNMRVTLEKVGHHFYRILHSPEPNGLAEPVAFLRDALPPARPQGGDGAFKGDDKAATRARQTEDAPAGTETPFERKDRDAETGPDGDSGSMEPAAVVAVDVREEGGKGKSVLARVEAWRLAAERERERRSGRRDATHGRDRSTDGAFSSGAEEGAGREREDTKMSENRRTAPDPPDALEKATDLPVSPGEHSPAMHGGRKHREAQDREGREDRTRQTEDFAQDKLQLELAAAPAVLSAEDDPSCSVSPRESVGLSPSSLPRDTCPFSTSSRLSLESRRQATGHSANLGAVLEEETGRKREKGTGGGARRRESNAAANADEPSEAPDDAALHLSRPGKGNQVWRPEAFQQEGRRREQPFVAVSGVNTREEKSQQTTRPGEGLDHGEAAACCASVQGVSLPRGSEGSDAGAVVAWGQVSPSADGRQQGVGSEGEVGREGQGGDRHSRCVLRSPREAVEEAVESPSAAPSRASSGGQSEDGDSCIICFQSRPNAVLLFCGHGGLCFPCAQTCFRRNGRCPSCRQAVKGVVELQDDSGPAAEGGDSQEQDEGQVREPRGSRRSLVTATVKDVKKS